MKHIYKIILPLISFCAVPLYAAKPSYDPQGAWWLNVGWGAGIVSTKKDEGDPGPGVSISYSANYAISDINFIEARFMETSNLFLGSGSFNDEKTDSMFDVGVLYGIMKKSEYVMIGAAAGLAYTQIHYSKETTVYDPLTNSYNDVYSTSNGATVGVPLEVQFFLKPVRYLGIGLIGVANLNTEAPAFGAQLGIQIGNK